MTQSWIGDCPQMEIASFEIGGEAGADSTESARHAYIQIGNGQKEEEQQHGDRGLGGETAMHEM